MSVVWSCNEWDQLEEVIVGNPLRARFPTPDLSTRLAEFSDRSLEKIPTGPFPQQIIEETEEDLSAFFGEIGDFFMTAHLREFVAVGFLMYMLALLLPFASLLWVLLIKLFMGGDIYRNKLTPGLYPK